MTTDDLPSLRVGLLGLDRNGWHLLERGTAACPFQVVAVSDSSVDQLQRAERFGIRGFKSPDQLIDSTNIDVIWIACSNEDVVDLTLRSLQSGRSVVWEPSVIPQCRDTDSFVEKLQDSDKRLFIHLPASASPDFQSAWESVRSHQLGKLNSARWISWDYGINPSKASDGPFNSLDTQLHQIVTQSLGQLLRLSSSAPVRVLAVESQEATTGGVTGMLVAVEFSDRVIGQVDVRLDSPVPFQSGWVLCGDRGGYSAGQLRTVASDGEVFESLLSVPHSPVDSLAELAREVRSSADDSVEDEWLKRLLKLLHAMRRSSAAHTVVNL